MNKTVAVAVTGTLVPHDLGRDDLADCDEHGVKLIVGHCLQKGQIGVRVLCWNLQLET